MLPGMNAEVDISIARSENALTIPVMALRTDRDIATTAVILGMTEQELRTELAGNGGDEAAAGSGDESRASITVRGQTIELPEGVDADAVRAAMQKRRSGGTLTDEERRLMRSVFEAAGGPAGRSRDREASDYRFGGDFWVVVDRQGDNEIRKIRTGITDLDRVEILSGLDEGEAILVLPSSHLVETQQQLQNWINRRIGRSVPGIGR